MLCSSLCHRPPRVAVLATAGLCRPLNASFAKTATGHSTEEELSAARQWLAKFNADSIPRSICDVGFSRASGPGGQNVNKVNSKATLRIPLDKLLALLPSALCPEVRASRFCSHGSNAVVIQSDDSRKQSENVQNCFKKLHGMIVEAGEKTVPGETSDSQKARVQRLQNAANEGRLKAKRLHSNKKSARKGGGRFDDS